MRPTPPLRDPPSRVRRLVRSPSDLEEPILAELFSAERLEQHARTLARAQAVTPAAEWLVDNFPIVDEQLREIRDDLPPDYYHELPKLAEGHLEGYPRVLG